MCVFAVSTRFKKRNHRPPGAVWGGRLTALCLETRQLTQVECAEYRVPGEEPSD